jgi:uncharacterized membrane protein SpoIIM required for sporulation
LNETRFVELREPDWQRLVNLCDRAEASATFLSTEDFHELVRCYRRTSSDLALARTINTNPDLTRFLNDIVGRAYGTLYRSPRKPFGAAIMQVLTIVAQTGRRRKWFILGSAFGFFACAILAFVLMDVAPATRAVLDPPAMQANTEAWKKGLPVRSSTQSAGATGMYATNNPLVAILGMAKSSVTFGIGGVEDLYQNGSMVGSLAHEMRGVGKLTMLIIWLLPHGVTELSGLFVSAGAGFCLAWALIHPGRRRRGEALAEAGKDAIVLLGTSVVMMFIAAPFEGYFSFNPYIPYEVKLIVAIVVASAWAAFWIGFGRTEAESAAFEPAPA